MALNRQTFADGNANRGRFVAVMLAGLPLTAGLILFSDTFWLLVGIFEVDENNLW
jgi:hypothetical protein